MEGKQKLCKLCCGIILLVIGLAATIWTPTYLLLKEKLSMMPGLPSFEGWKDPPQTLLVKIYVFNITNRDKFLSGRDAKLRVEEVGPVVYRERWIHRDVVFNDNDTMTYTVTHMPVLASDLTHIDLNATVTVANTPMLGVLSYFANAPFYIPMLPLSYVMKIKYSDTLMNMTLYQYLHHWENPLLDALNKLAPSILSIKNLGAMEFLYRNNSTDRVTVFFGESHGPDRYMLMDNYDGTRNVPYQDDTCKVTMLNATEGLLFTPLMTEGTVIRYFRKPMCTVLPVHYKNEMERLGLKVYMYSVRNDSFDRTHPLEDDCSKGHPMLPDGLLDISKCYYNFPVALSFPHFTHGDSKIHSYVDGLKPNESLHDSYTIVEPRTGIPVESAARCQVNLVINPLSQMDEAFDKFSDVVIPMFWVEYIHPELPVYLQNILYVTVKILPVAEWIFVATTLILGTVLTYDYVRKRKNRTPCIEEEKMAKENAFSKFRNLCF